MLNELCKEKYVVKVDNRIGEVLDFFIDKGVLYCHWRFLDKPIVVVLKKDKQGKPYLIEKVNVLSIVASSIIIEVV